MSHPDSTLRTHGIPGRSAGSAYSGGWPEPPCEKLELVRLPCFGDTMLSLSILISLTAILRGQSQGRCCGMSVRGVGLDRLDYPDDLLDMHFRCCMSSPQRLRPIVCKAPPWHMLLGQGNASPSPALTARKGFLFLVKPCWSKFILQKLPCPIPLPLEMLPWLSWNQQLPK